ncbi:hypothetical protein niasHS_017214 [Heterodera schachtii]|uniref:Uncharacterized protein n=1 Tax=Heterodera schachtii TaxID=97005 RepID=A0ABD2I0K8_HETSC
MPVKLESLKATFNLGREDKPLFPYYYNKKEHYGIRLEHLPPIEDYSPGSINKEKFAKFEKWSCTNAGVAMNIIKAMFLLTEQLSIVPEKGYERCDRASVMAIKYLEWRSKRDETEIRHAGNGREVET